MKAFSNFIPDKPVTFDDKDPAWMAQSLKDKIKWKNDTYTYCVKNGKTITSYLKLKQVTKGLSEAISETKNDYHN